MNNTKTMGTSELTSTIYVLIDPRNFCVKYVGRTESIRERLKQHCADAYSTRHYEDVPEKSKWILELRELNLKPLIKEVIKCRNEDAPYFEKIICVEYALRCNIFNDLTYLNHNRGLNPIKLNKTTVNN